MPAPFHRILIALLICVGAASAEPLTRHPARWSVPGKHHAWSFAGLTSAQSQADPARDPDRAGARNAPAPRSSMDALQVAAVQIATTDDIGKNARLIVEAIASEAQLGTRLVAFEECALTSYEDDALRRADPAAIDRALKTIVDACREHDIYAVVGSPYREDDRWYNGAFVFDPRGRLIKRYAKMHVVKPRHFAEGHELAIFRIDDVPATIMVCHDQRYPEIFRIPVLAGARLGIYISCESKTPAKWDNYRSQIIARAVENQISILQCNAGDRGDAGGSHGHSRIIDPQGNILAEAGEGVGEAIRAVVRPRASMNHHAHRGANSPALRAFWEEGLRVLRAQNPEFYEEGNVGR